MVENWYSFFAYSIPLVRIIQTGIEIPYILFFKHEINFLDWLDCSNLLIYVMFWLSMINFAFFILFQDINLKNYVIILKSYHLYVFNWFFEYWFFSDACSDNTRSADVDRPVFQKYVFATRLFYAMMRNGN